MSTLPVFDTVGETYRFSFSHYLRLFAITWLPILIVTVASYFVMRDFFPEYIEFLKEVRAAAPGTPPPNPFVVMPHLGRIWLVDLAMVFFFVMIAIGITKEVLGVREEPGFVYFRFGAAELRLLGGFVGVVVVVGIAIVVASVIAGIAVGIAMAGMIQHDPQAMLRVMVPVLIAIYAIGFYFIVRLTFFLAPVVVAEKRIGVERAWELSSGNFWRIFAVGLLIWIPLMVAEMVLVGIILAPAIMSAIPALQSDPHTVPIAIFQAYAAKLPYMLVLVFFLSPILYGLILAPAAIAYKAVNPQAPPA